MENSAGILLYALGGFLLIYFLLKLMSRRPLGKHTEVEAKPCAAPTADEEQPGDGALAAAIVAAIAAILAEEGQGRKPGFIVRRIRRV